MVGDIKSEWWARSSRNNGGPASLGIISRNGKDHPSGSRSSMPPRAPRRVLSSRLAIKPPSSRSRWRPKARATVKLPKCQAARFPWRRPSRAAARVMPRPSMSARKSRSALRIEPSSWEGLSRYAALRLVADSLPLRRSASTSSETFWPSARPRIPDRSTALMCTNTSLPPWSGWMKP